MNELMDSIDVIIQKKVKEIKTIHYNIPFLKHSAILIPILKQNNEIYVIMTKRSTKLTKHNGEMSFPGGKFDEGVDKSLKDTMLRETREEIGLFPHQIQILGELDDLPTFTGYNIHPFIGFIDGDTNQINFVKNIGEVDQIVFIPFKFLREIPHYKENIFKSPDLRTFHFLSFTYQDPRLKQQFYIWGASAHILANFFDRLFEAPKWTSNYDRPSILDIYNTRKIRKKKL